MVCSLKSFNYMISCNYMYMCIQNFIPYIWKTISLNYHDQNCVKDGTRNTGRGRGSNFDRGSNRGNRGRSSFFTPPANYARRESNNIYGIPIAKLLSTISTIDQLNELQNIQNVFNSSKLSWYFIVLQVS